MEEHERLIDHKETIEGKYTVYRFRWIVLIVYTLMNVANAMTWVTFSPISDKVEEYFNTSSFWVNNLSLIFLVTYIPFGFVGTWFLDNKGLRLGSILGALLTIAGVWIRVASKWSFWFALTGQFFAALSQTLIIPTPPKLAAHWFSMDQRALATTIASVSNPIGVALGFILPPAIVNKPEDLFTLLLIQAVLLSALSLPAILFMREHPPTPPSASAAEIKKETIFESLLEVVKNKDMWILFIEFGFGLGAFNTLATIINQMLVPYGYNNTQSGILGAAVVVSGLVGSAIAGPLIDKTKKFKWTLIFCLSLATVAMTLLTFSLKPNNFVILVILGCFLGFAMTPVIPVTLELCAEITYPLGEATPTGFLLMSGQLTGIGFILLMDYFLHNHYIKAANFTIVGCFIFSVFALFFLKEDLKRLNKDKDKSIN